VIVSDFCSSNALELYVKEVSDLKFSQVITYYN
jgi:hypothetical protein